MKKVLLAYVLVALTTPIHLNAMNEQSAVMKVIKSNGFGDIENVKFTLTKNQGNQDIPFYMTLEYKDDVKILEVKSQNISKEDCGRITYIGNIPSGSEWYRYTARLTDYSSCTGENPYGFKWHVEARAGFGWCGTGDPIMEMIGNPE